MRERERESNSCLASDAGGGGGGARTETALLHTRAERERETSEDALQGKKDESGTHPPVCLYAGKNIHLFLLMSMSPVAVKCHQLLSLSYFLK